MDPDNTNNNGGSISSEPVEETASPAINNPLINTEPPIKNKKWKKILTIVGITIIVIPLLGFLALVISLSGGIGGVISNLKSAPNPESKSVTSKRNAAKDSINSSFSELNRKIGFTNYATSSHDRCYEGQNNWKVKDGYAHRCTYRVTKFYGFDGDFRQQMISFEQKLFSSGWRPAYNSEPPIKEIMENYYDSYYGNKDPQVSQNFGGNYLVSSLPTPIGGYLKNMDLLEIEYAEKATKDYFQIDYAQNVSRDTLSKFYDKKEFQDINLLLKKITQGNNFVLVISIQENYFQN